MVIESGERKKEELVRTMVVEAESVCLWPCRLCFLRASISAVMASPCPVQSQPLFPLTTFEKSSFSTARTLPTSSSSHPRTTPSTLANMSVPSLAPYIMKRPWLQKWMKPLSQWYFDNAGYRKLGLRYAVAIDGADRADVLERRLRGEGHWPMKDYPWLTHWLRQGR